MDWIRGKPIGSGSFSTVHLAVPKDPAAPLMAVKSSDLFDSAQLENEIKVLSELQGCDNVIRCFGGCETVENGERWFNLVMEYAPGGSLAQLVKNSGGIAESEARVYAKSILKGLRFVHQKGFVHCDVKLQNLLICENGELKIADFGLAKKSGGKLGKVEFRGTPLYMSPESVNENEYDSPCDIWALGIAVIEMITGKPAWRCNLDNAAALLVKIGVGEELPAIPEVFTYEAKDFVSKCLIKDPKLRWTAEMLLNHPFVANDSAVAISNAADFSSPRCHFEFQDWVSIPSSTPSSELWTRREVESRIDWSALTSSPSLADRIRRLTGDRSFNWTCSDSWVGVR